MNISIKNIDNGARTTWNFKSRENSIKRMTDLTSLMRRIPEHILSEGLRIIIVFVSDAQLDCILANMPNNSESIFGLSRSDILQLRYNN